MDASVKAFDAPPPARRRSGRRSAHALLRRLVDLAVGRARHDAGALDGVGPDQPQHGAAVAPRPRGARSDGRLGLLGLHVARRPPPRARGHLGRAVGRGRDEPRGGARHRRDRGRLERVARGEDLPPARLRDHRSADRARHRGPPRPRPADEAPHLERHLRLRALAVDRRGARAALRARDAERHARARPDGRSHEPARGRRASPTSTSTTATGAATGSTRRRSATASSRRST